MQRRPRIIFAGNQLNHGSTDGLDVKTERLYSPAMASRLINVRLDSEDERIARELRRRGVSISDVVRRALRAEAGRTATPQLDGSSLIAEMVAQFPTPARARGRKRLDTTDRRAVQALIAARLRSAR